MTSPNISSTGDVPDAANAQGINALSNQAPAATLQGQMNQTVGPLGAVASGLMGGIAGGLISKANASAANGTPSAMYNAANFVSVDANTAKENSNDPVLGTVEGLINGIFSGWFGANPDESTPERANYTIRAIKDAVLNGYIVSTYTSSGMFTVTDQMTELVVACVGGGENGSGGGQPAAGLGGSGGGYQVFQLDVAEILNGATSVDVPITIGTAGAKTHFGTWAESAAGLGGIATSFGWTPTSSTPGDGGDGGKGGEAGSVAGKNGTDGGSTAMAAGGARGTGGNGNAPNGTAGASGGSVDPAAVVKCCGAGGAGGGGGYCNSGLVAYAGGAGGNGGYPGGGGGGGGGKGAGAGSGSPGGGGYGAPGVLFIFRKELS